MNQLTKKISVLVAVLLTGLSFYYFGSIWLYIILAAIISLIVRPFTKIVHKIKFRKKAIPSGLIAAVSLFLFWFFLFIFLRIFIPLILNEANELSKINTVALESQFYEPIKYTQTLIDQLIIQNQDFNFKEYFSEKITTILNLEQIKDFLSGTIGAIGNIFIAIFAISFIAFFFIKDNHLLMNGILTLVPNKREQQVRSIVEKITKLLSRYFAGLIIEVLAIILLVSIGLWIVGIAFSHAIVIGLIAGMLNVIPYIGPLIGMAFGTIIGLATELTNEIPDNLYFIFVGIIAVFLIAQLIDNFVLQPLIYSNSVNASPLEIFLLILMAGTIGGISGMILAIPFYTIFRVVAKETLNHFKIINKLTKDI